MNTAANLNINDNLESEVEHTTHEYGEVWRLNGKPHRTDGPAIISINGDYEYYQHGLLHNDKGPAIRFYTYVHNGFRGNVPVTNYRWFLNGECVSPREWRKRTGNETFFEKFANKLKRLRKKD